MINFNNTKNKDFMLNFSHIDEDIQYEDSLDQED